MKEKINQLSYDLIYEQWDDYRHSKPIDECVVDFVKLIKPNGLILDVGCGSGYPIDNYLSNLNFKVIGIDISFNMIKKANQLNLSNAQFINCDFLKYKTNLKFDGIIAFDSLWHINYHHQKIIYKRLSNLLKSGGYLLFTHGKNDNEQVNEMFGQKFYYSALDLSCVKKILDENNLQIIDLKIDYKHPYSGTRELLMTVRKK